MPILNVGGQRVRVGDEFLSLSPDMQNQTVDEIARSLPGGSAIEAPTASARGTASGRLDRSHTQPGVSPRSSVSIHTFEIQDNDGSVYEVQAPDEQVAIAGFKKYRGGSAQEQTFEAGSSSLPPGFVLDRPPASAGLSSDLPPGFILDSPPDVGMATAAGRGAAQGFTLGGYDELRGLSEAGGVKPNDPMSLGSLIKGGYNLLTGSGNPEYEAGKSRAAAELKTAQQQYPMTTGAGEIGGALTGGLMLAPLSLTGNAARLGMGLRGATLGSVGDGAILGGIHGALNADEGKRWEEAKSGAKFGAGVGLVAPLAISGVSNAFRRVVTPMTISPERQAAADVLRNEGVGLSAGQTTGSKNLRYAEGEIGGRTAEHLMERQGEQFTRAALSRAGINADRATPEVIDNAFTRIGRQFDDLAARNQIVPDQRLVADLQGVVSEYTSLVPDAMRAPVVRNVAQNIVDAIRRGSISGESYQALRSQFERQARTSGANVQLSDALHGLREALDDAMQRTLVRTNPQDLGHWQQARRQYKNMLVLEKAATGAGENAALGLISPAALRNAAVQQGRRAYARGQGDFSDLARAGEALMKPMPQSGTAPRQAVRNLGAFVPMALGGSAGYASGSPSLAIAGMLMGAAVPRAVGAAMMSRPGQAYLTNQVLPGNISPATRAIANALLGNGILTARDRR